MTRSKPYHLNPKKFLSKEEQLIALRNISNAPEEHQLLILVALKSGGRAQEILNLTIKDLDVSEKSIYLTGLKGSLDRLVPLEYTLFDRLYAFAKEKVQGSIWSIQYRMYLIIWQRYVPKSIKAARHTFAIELYQRSKDLRLVQRALGHKSINNTMIYADYSYTATEMRKLLIGDE